MKKVIISIICSFLLINTSFVFAEETTCKEEIIENAYNPVISSDWKHFAYVFKKNNWKHVIIKDWKEFWWEYERIDNLEISTNWKIIYVWTEWDELNKKVYVITDDYKSESYDSVYNISFSSDWNSFSFKWIKWNIPIDYKEYIIKDWKLLWEWTDFLYSPNWKDYAYVLKINWKYQLYKNWIKFWDEYENIYWLIFSINWENLAYFIKNDWKYYAANNLVIEKVWYESIVDLIVSPNWGSISYKAKTKDKWYLINDWEELISFELFNFWRFSYPSKFSSDWTSFSYFITWEIVNWKKYSYVVKDWVKSNYYDKIYNPEYIIWSNILTFIAENEWKIFLVKDFKEYDLPSKNEWKYVWYFYNNSTKTELYYLVNNTKNYIVSNWVPTKEYSKIDNFTFSLDYNNYYFIWKNDNKYYFIKNWVEILKDYNEILKNIKYTDDFNIFAFNTLKDWKIQLTIINCSNNNTNFNNYILKSNDLFSSNTNSIINNSVSKVIENNYKKQLIISKTRLNKTTKWKNYIKQIDSIVWKLDTNKLEKLYNKIIKIENRWKYQDLLDYLEASIWVKLWK